MLRVVYMEQTVRPGDTYTPNALWNSMFETGVEYKVYAIQSAHLQSNNTYFYMWVEDRWRWVPDYLFKPVEG